MPQQVVPHGDRNVTGGVEVLCRECSAEDLFAAQNLREGLTERHIPMSTAAAAFRISLQKHAESSLITPEMKAEGYAITTSPQGLTLTAATSTGLFYASQTAKQMLGLDAASRTVVHQADIRDWPVLRFRGLSDDLSRGPIDSLEFQKKLIRTLASFKANVYSPYFEHTQQYTSNPLPAPPGGSMSAEDARELVAYARQYHVTVIPDQEAFGHLHHNLVWEQYTQLAETPHGAVLAPAQPGSVQLISQIFSELAQMYSSPFLHIGADETVDLGRGQTKSAVDSQGLATVYLNYLQQINTALQPLHRRLLFWGDIAQDSPDQVKALPDAFKKNVIAVAWSYSPRSQGFAKFIKPFTDAGIETWVAPGINNWSRLYPNWNMGLLNIQQFTRDGVSMGATGQLNTLWNDDGETLASNNYLGIVFGAAQAWQGGQGSISQFQSDFGPVFHGDLSGKLNQAQAEIMLAQAILKDGAKAGDAADGLFWIDPWSHDGQTYAAELRPHLHEIRLHAERALTLIAEARAAYPAAAAVESPSPGAGSAKPVRPREAAEHITDEPVTENPYPATSLREADAIDALELGARRIDFACLKFQLSDEIPTLYAQSQVDAASTDPKIRRQVIWELSAIRGANGRMEDIMDSYSLLRDLYARQWLRTNRVYGLRPVLEHFDSTINLWYTRIDRLHAAERQWNDSKTLPAAVDLGLPPIAH